MTTLQSLADCVSHYTEQQQPLPFSVFRCCQPQQLHQVPILSPTFIFVLRGQKQLNNHQTANAGDFIFLHGGQNVMLSNIPDQQQYLALVLELQPQDKLAAPPSRSEINSTLVTESVTSNSADQSGHDFIAVIPDIVLTSLQQMADWSVQVDHSQWYIRRREILQLLLDEGYHQISQAFSNDLFSTKVTHLLQQQPQKNWSQADLCQQLAISEATLRRRLLAENTSFRELLESVRMSVGLDLLQTTQLPINLVAERCGYLSASRFAERFKQRFRLTPSQLRKTQSA